MTRDGGEYEVLPNHRQHQPNSYDQYENGLHTQVSSMDAVIIDNKMLSGRKQLPYQN